MRHCVMGHPHHEAAEEENCKVVGGEEGAEAAHEVHQVAGEDGGTAAEASEKEKYKI